MPDDIEGDARLRLRTATFVDDNTIEFDFEGVGTPDRRYRARRSGPEGVALTTFDGEFSRLYRGVPCLSAGMSLNQLAHAMWASRDDALPAEAAYDAAMNQCRDAVETRWNTSD